jgi:phenylpyruvate tautomerase PptA (4-oxalocrotonate tautomerase family)
MSFWKWYWFAMPLLKITTSVPPAREHGKLLANLSQLCADRLGKPESYVMTAIDHPSLMTFAGTTEPACYVELKNVGRFSSELTQRLSAELCERLSTGLGVAKNRIYIEFADAEGYLWGHDGETFG